MKNLNDTFFHQFSEIYLKNNLKNKMVVYTAILNKYDELKDPLVYDKDVDYVCFTDNKKISSSIWKIIQVNQFHRDSRRTARKIKLLGHKIFKKHKINLWIDGSFLIKGSIKKFCELYYDKSLSCFSHPDRNCVFDEIKVSSFKCDPKLLEKQFEDYNHYGLPKNIGLISSGILLRNNSNKKIINLMNCWSNQVDLYSSRDQVSFSYCLWKLKERYNLIPLNIYKNDFFEIQTHSKFFFFNNKAKKIINFIFLLNLLRYFIIYFKQKFFK